MSLRSKVHISQEIVQECPRVCSLDVKSFQTNLLSICCSNINRSWATIPYISMINESIIIYNSYFNVDIQIFILNIQLHIFITRKTNLQGISDYRILSLNLFPNVPTVNFLLRLCITCQKTIQHFLGFIKIHVLLNGLSCTC